MRIVHDAGGRFLTLSSVPGLLREVKREKGLVHDSLDLHREFLQKHQREDSMRKLKIAITHQEFEDRMKVFL